MDYFTGVTTDSYEEERKGQRKVSERPIRFKDAKGRDKSAISMSERLPKGTEMKCTLRVRTESPFTEDALRKIFTLGRNLGFGAWRGSGHKGAYVFKLKKLRGFVDPEVPEGWE